jgi:hypothetical protein
MIGDHLLTIGREITLRTQGVHDSSFVRQKYVLRWIIQRVKTNGLFNTSRVIINESTICCVEAKALWARPANYGHRLTGEIGCLELARAPRHPTVGGNSAALLTRDAAEWRMPSTGRRP